MSVNIMEMIPKGQEHSPGDNQHGTFRGDGEWEQFSKGNGGGEIFGGSYASIFLLGGQTIEYMYIFKIENFSQVKPFLVKLKNLSKTSFQK